MTDTKPEENLARRLALRAALAYVLTAGLWIIVSDGLSALFFPEAALLQKVQIFKGILFVVVTALLLYLLIRNILSRQYQLELARRQSETNYRQLFDGMLNGFALCEIIVDEQGVPCDFRYLEINPAFERLTGLKRETVLGKRVREVIPGIESRWIEAYGNVALNGNEMRFQDYVADLDIHFDIMAFSPQKGRFAAIFDNITHRKLAERKVARLTSLYAALSQSNQAIVRIGEREPLFREICRVAVELGGFRFAWIGIPESGGWLHVAASHGDDQGYLDEIKVCVDANSPYGLGPGGIAVREGRTCIVEDIGDATDMAPWRADLVQRGIRSIAAFPLNKRDGQAAGALILYAAESQYFDQAMIDLLNEMAMDISFALDNFERKEARSEVEARLRESEVRFRTIFDSINDAIFVQDAETGAIVDVNQRMCEMFGYRHEEALHLDVDKLSSGVPPYTRQDAEQWTRKTLQGAPQAFEWQAKARDGRLFWVEVNMRLALIGGARRLLVSVRDISERKKAEKAIYHLTRYDALTGLPNQFLLEYRLNRAIGQAAESRHPIGVMMLNLDNFHTVNDSVGYDTGDLVLLNVARRLSAAVDEQDTVARLGADTFALLALSPGDIKEFIGKLETLLVTIAQILEIDGREIQVNASIGVSFFPDDGNTALELVQKAGIAMRHAKSDGGNAYRFFAQDMNARAQEQMALSNSLRHAQERNQLVLHYQPQVDAFSGQIVGVEALLRWQHPEQGMLMPGKFIALAEENGLIVPIGDWVLREACRQARIWHEAGHARPFVSVNVSALQFKQSDLAKSAIKAITESGLAPHFVELELTESMLMSHFEQTLAALKELKAFGVRFSIDDFGTGYSSLNYLKHFPIDKLKIDISFVTDIVTDADNAAIVKAMIAMGHSLELKVIAKGVETEAQAGYLRTLHCDEMQGFYFSRPVPAQEIAALLEQHPPLRNGSGDERILLLVDDEANVISALRRILRRDGYHILTADNAQEGLELLAKHPVGVILSDQRMPGMTGIEFLSKVKVMYPNIVRMVLSGYTEVNTMRDAINRGAIYKFLTKPWEDEPLREAIKEAFLRHETQRDEERRP